MATPALVPTLARDDSKGRMMTLDHTETVPQHVRLSCKQKPRFSKTVPAPSVAYAKFSSETIIDHGTYGHCIQCLSAAARKESSVRGRT
jgi:hypothetical protein